MRWYATQFTHYTGDDMFENFEPDDYFPLDADTLSDAVHQAAQTVYGPAVPPLCRIDDGNDPYGGVFTLSRYARRYFILNDFTLSSLPVFGVFADWVVDCSSCSATPR